MSDVSAKPYKLGIALSGGGARGFAHVGALRAMEELGIKPDVVAGVSAGSVVAVMYAAGVPLDKMMKLFKDTKFRDLCEFSVKGGGFFKIDRFKKLVQKAVGEQYQTLESLPIPVHIGVTDLDGGVPVDFTAGNLTEVMAASCSIPILFYPVVIDGVRYVDGGVLRNMPAWTIRNDCEYVIGVNCSPLVAQSAQKKNSIFEIGMRTYHLMSKCNVQDDTDRCDVVIELPEIASYKVFNLKEINQVYLRGYTSAKHVLKQWLAEHPEVLQQ